MAGREIMYVNPVRYHNNRDTSKIGADRYVKQKTLIKDVVTTVNRFLPILFISLLTTVLATTTHRMPPIIKCRDITAIMKVIIVLGL